MNMNSLTYLSRRMKSSCIYWSRVATYARFVSWGQPPPPLQYWKAMQRHLSLRAPDHSQVQTQEHELRENGPRWFLQTVYCISWCYLGTDAVIIIQCEKRQLLVKGKAAVNGKLLSKYQKHLYVLSISMVIRNLLPWAASRLPHIS